jgi:hypothetical protein
MAYNIKLIFSPTYTLTYKFSFPSCRNNTVDIKVGGSKGRPASN